MSFPSQIVRWLARIALLLPVAVQAVVFQPRLINGTPVEPGTYQNVVRIQADGAGCTATIVGPKVLITAAHCARTGATASFTLNGSNYTAKITRSPLYPQQDHDIAIGVIDSTISGVEFSSIGGKAQVGLTLTLLGYGCTTPGGEDEPDGKLRKGDTVIKSFSNYDMESSKPNGAALCFGDSGGPAYVQDGGKTYLLGINSKGNIQDTNLNTRLDLDVSTQFLQKMATEKAIEICGVNKNCGGTDPEQPPTCTLAAQPNQISLGQSLALNFSASGKATSATLEGTAISVPTGQRMITPAAKGNFTATATVTGPGGSNSCSANYSVVQQTPPAPTCTISATPENIKIGQSLVARLMTQGQVSNATIDGIAVASTGGSLTITPKVAGLHTVAGVVSGPGGFGNCSANYNVDGVIPPDPPFAAYTVVPLHCGVNSILETPVKEVCLATLSHKTAREVVLRDALLLTFSDGSQETLPVLGRRVLPAPSPGDTLQSEELVSYGNAIKTAGPDIVLITKKATLVTRPGVELPVSLEGRSSNGQYFFVDTFRKLTSRKHPDR